MTALSVCSLASQACRRLAPACAIAALAGSATADGIVDIIWDANARFERSVQVAPGKLTEICGKLPAGQAVRWEFAATAAVDFNVHYHVAKDVVYPTRLFAINEAKDTLDTRIEQDYCWMWSNKGAAPATVRLKLQR